MGENLELENMIDKTSLDKVLSDLVDICNAKGQHLIENWQDKTACHIWEQAARHINHARTRLIPYPGIT